MIHLNLRQKMILCFCLHLTFYGLTGVTFLKSFNAFNEDISLLMHVSNLSNTCLEIRRYEKNFIIHHEKEDYIRVGQYVAEAQKYVPEVKNDLKLIVHPLHLDNLQKTLVEYEKAFHTFKTDCRPEQSDTECPSRQALRNIGQDMVQSTEGLVEYEQNKMKNFIADIRQRLYQSIMLLVMLSIFTVFMLYGSIVMPLKSIERAADEIAAGTFRKLRLSGKKNEVTSVFRAFNNMSTELEQQQKQLFQAKKLSSIGTLASGTAHQINNPLNNIATSCQLALAEIDPKQAPFVEQMLQTIDQETQRAGKIVRGLLEFSRAQTFSMQPVLLKVVVYKAIQLATGELPSGITLHQNIPPEITLRLDSQKMVEALLNLILNGVQAISEPPGRVTIKARVEDEHTILTIEDTGDGISKENLAKVFDPFFTTKQTGEGTGLGLAVVYGIIKKHHGTTHVESEQDKGTTFIITLPNYTEPRAHRA